MSILVQILIVEYIYTILRVETKIPSILTKHDISIIPLTTPIFGAVPSKIYESMAAGLPILFNGGGEGAKIVKENSLGWISKPKDYESINNNIKHIINMKEHEFQKLN